MPYKLPKGIKKKAVGLAKKKFKAKVKGKESKPEREEKIEGAKGKARRSVPKDFSSERISYNELLKLPKKEQEKYRVMNKSKASVNIISKLDSVKNIEKTLKTDKTLSEGEKKAMRANIKRLRREAYKVHKNREDK